MKRTLITLAVALTAAAPVMADEALAMLTRLAGRTHVVCTGCCVHLPGGAEEAFCATSEVTMHAWPEAALRAYAAGGEPEDKAGAYAIQGKAALFIEGIEGSYSNVVGLPLHAVARLARKAGVDLYDNHGEGSAG